MINKQGKTSKDKLKGSTSLLHTTILAGFSSTPLTWQNKDGRYNKWDHGWEAENTLLLFIYLFLGRIGGK